MNSSQKIPNKNIFKEIIAGSRLFDLLHTKLLENNKIEQKLLSHLIEYFISYADYYHLSVLQVTEIYTQFLNEYTLHLREFSKSKKYPYQNNIQVMKSRLDYDIPLLCSTFLTYHRFHIMEILSNRLQLMPEQTVLIVGVGPGIELSLFSEKAGLISAYDTKLSDFVRKKFPKVSFFEKYFQFEPGQRYDHIFLIEILEHIDRPQVLLEDAMKSLKDNGRIHFTTAINVPQFDHLYNFELDDKNVENWVSANNFEIEYKSDIPHNYYPSKVDAYNSYYIVKKK